MDNQEFDNEKLVDANDFKLEIHLELLISGKAINVHCNEDRIEVSVGRIYFLGLWTPFKIDVRSFSAEFDCKDRKLRIFGKRKVEIKVEEKKTVKLNPVSLSDNNLLYDVI